VILYTDKVSLILYTDIAVCQVEADTLQYEYRGLGEAHADTGNRFIPVTIRSSEHTSSIGRCSVKFAEVVLQGLELEERLVDRNGMALFRVVVITPRVSDSITWK
jgi:hypothetical protein